MNQSQNSQVALLIGEFVYNPILLVHISICGKLSLSKAISCPLFVGFTAEVCVESRWQQNWQRSQGWSSHCGYLSRFRLEANRYRVAWRSEGQWVNDAQNTDGKSGLEKLRTFLDVWCVGGQYLRAQHKHSSIFCKKDDENPRSIQGDELEFIRGIQYYTN